MQMWRARVGQGVLGLELLRIEDSVDKTGLNSKNKAVVGSSAGEGGGWVGGDSEADSSCRLLDLQLANVPPYASQPPSVTW